MDIATDVLSRLERIEREIGNLKNELISLEQWRDKKRGAVNSFIDASLQKKESIPESAVSIIRKERRER